MSQVLRVCETCRAFGVTTPKLCHRWPDGELQCGECLAAEVSSDDGIEVTPEQLDHWMRTGEFPWERSSAAVLVDGLVVAAMIPGMALAIGGLALAVAPLAITGRTSRVIETLGRVTERVDGWFR